MLRLLRKRVKILIGIVVAFYSIYLIFNLLFGGIDAEIKNKETGITPAFIGSQELYEESTEDEAAEQYYLESTTISSTTTKISTENLVHFLGGFEFENFTLSSFLAVKAAKINGKASKIYFHYHKLEPEGDWFEKAKQFIDKIIPVPSSFILERTDAPMTDYVRLKILQEYGGIYLDLDVFVLKDLTSFWNASFVIANDKSTGTELVSNSFIATFKNNSFITTWMSFFTSTHTPDSDYYCCRLPQMLLRRNQNVISLKSDTFYEPSKDHMGLKDAFLDKFFEYDKNYATKLWENSNGKKFLKNLTLDKILMIDNSIFCRFRTLIDKEDKKTINNGTADGDEDCKMGHVSQRASRYEVGMIGFWDFGKTKGSSSIRKVLDSSGNRLHGILNPLNAYESHNGNVFKSNDNFYRFYNGDHAYLPTGPHVPSGKMTLLIKFRVQPDSSDSIRFLRSRKSTLLSIRVKMGSSFFHERLLNLETKGWKSLVFTADVSESANDYPLTINQWCYVAIFSNNAIFTAAVYNEKLKQFDQENYLELPKVFDLMTIIHWPIQGIWIGRKAPMDLVADDEEAKNRAQFDVQRVAIFNVPKSLEELSNFIKEKEEKSSSNSS